MSWVMFVKFINSWPASLVDRSSTCCHSSFPEKTFHHYYYCYYILQIPAVLCFVVCCFLSSVFVTVRAQLSVNMSCCLHSCHAFMVTCQTFSCLETLAGFKLIKFFEFGALYLFYAFNKVTSILLFGYFKPSRQKRDDRK